MGNLPNWEWIWRAMTWKRRYLIGHTSPIWLLIWNLGLPMGYVLPPYMAILKRKMRFQTIKLPPQTFLQSGYVERMNQKWLCETVRIGPQFWTWCSLFSKPWDAMGVHSLMGLSIGFLLINLVQHLAKDLGKETPLPPFSCSQWIFCWHPWQGYTRMYIIAVCTVPKTMYIHVGPYQNDGQQLGTFFFTNFRHL